MKQIVLLVLGLAALGAACNRTDKPAVLPYSEGVINLAGRSVSLDFADGPAEQTLGLSGRASIEDNQGMVFMFDYPYLPEFWMKDMNFPIDIVWIKGDQVVDITADVQPEPGVPVNGLKTYAPKEPTDKVLELKAGWTSRNGLKIGDKIEILRFVQ